MKKLYTFLILFMIGFTSHAQDDNKSHKGLYFGFKTGYTIPVAKSTIGSPRTEVGNRILVSSNTGTYSYSEKNPFGTRGAGVQVAGSIGYMFNNNFGIEMEFSFLRSARILDGSRDETSLINTVERNYFAEQYSYTNMFRAAPMLVVSGNPSKKFVPYAKFGLILPLAGKTIVEVTINDETGELADLLLPILNRDLSDKLNGMRDFIPFVIPTESFIKAKTAGVFSLGFTARMGCSYNINDKWSIFGEMEMTMLTVKAKETEFVEFSSRVSNDALVILAELLLQESIQSEFGYNDLPEILRLTSYANELTQASNGSYDVNAVGFDRNSAYNQVTFRDNYNSFGLMLGFKYKFK